MEDQYNLSRFLEAQEGTYANALGEVRSGYKRGHWMWFVFPQVVGLGRSTTSHKYSIKSMREAKAYLKHDILSHRLREISQALVQIENLSARQIFGFPDVEKLKSSMTLFLSISDENDVFQKVLDKYFNGAYDWQTIEILKDI